MEDSCWERLTVGEAWSCCDGWGHAQSIFNSFFVDGRGCVPSLLFDLRPNYGGGGEDNGDLLKRSRTSLLQSVPPTLQQATADPCLCQRLLNTHRNVWVSFSWGHCSFLLGPGAHKILCVPSKGVFPQSCGSSVMKYHWPSKSNSLGFLHPFTGYSGWEVCCGP